LSPQNTIINNPNLSISKKHTHTHNPNLSSVANVQAQMHRRGVHLPKANENEEKHAYLSFFLF
jgi:hypothetical protein